MEETAHYCSVLTQAKIQQHLLLLLAAAADLLPESLYISAAKHEVSRYTVVPK